MLIIAPRRSVPVYPTAETTSLYTVCRDAGGTQLVPAAARHLLSGSCCCCRLVLVHSSGWRVALPAGYATCLHAVRRPVDYTTTTASGLRLIATQDRGARAGIGAVVGVALLGRSVHRWVGQAPTNLCSNDLALHFSGPIAPGSPPAQAQHSVGLCSNTCWTQPLNRQGYWEPHAFNQDQSCSWRNN